MTEDVKNYKKMLDIRDKLKYLEGVLDGINQVMDNPDDADYVNYIWHEFTRELDETVTEAKKLGMKVESYDDLET